MAEPISLGTLYSAVQIVRGILGGPSPRPADSLYRGIPGTGPTRTAEPPTPPPLAIAPTPPPVAAPPPTFLPPQPVPQPIPPSTPPPTIPPTTAPPAPQRPEIPIPKGDPDAGRQAAGLLRIIRRGVKLANRTQAAWDLGQWVGRKIYERYGTQILDGIDAILGNTRALPEGTRARVPQPRASAADVLPDRRATVRRPTAPRRGVALDLQDLFDAFADAKEVVRPKRKLTRAQRIRLGLPVPASTPPIAPAPAPLPTRPLPRFDQAVRRVLDVLPSPDRRIDRLRIPRQAPSPLPVPTAPEFPWTATPSPLPITPSPPSVPLPTPPSVVVGPTWPTPFEPPPSLDPSTSLSPRTSFSPPRTRTRDCECEAQRPRRRRGCTNPVVSRRKREVNGRILITTTREAKCPQSKLK